MKRNKIKNLVPKNLLDTLEKKHKCYQLYNDKFKGIFLTVYFLGFVIFLFCMTLVRGPEETLSILLVWLLVSSIPILLSLIFYIDYIMKLKQIERDYFFDEGHFFANPYYRSTWIEDMKQAIK